jgi:hypothetical protein
MIATTSNAKLFSQSFGCASGANVRNFQGKAAEAALLPNYLARYTVRPWFNEVKSRPCDRLGGYCHVSLPALGQRTPVWPNQMPMARTAIDGEDQRRGV